MNGSLLQSRSFGAFIVSIAFLCFVAGSAISEFKVFPYGHLRAAFTGATALFQAATAYNDRLESDFWHPARHNETGVSRYDPNNAFNGYTLYTSGHAQKAFLIAMNGRLAHEWGLPFSQVWDSSADVKSPRTDEFIYWRKAHLFPNGDLLAIYIAWGESPYGYGLVKVDKDSKLIWKYLQRVHHDVDVGEDGKIYALTHEIRRISVPGIGNLAAPLFAESVVVLSPDGEELTKVSVLEAFRDSDYRALLKFIPSDFKGDYLHTNAVEVVDKRAAALLPFAREGQVVLSFRTIDTIAVLDVESKKIVWALRGPWRGQHDPDILDNGNMLLFDNYGHFGPGGRSRILEFNPTTLEIVWQYTGSREEPFDSWIRSAQQRLPNGNTLITESDNGRLFEVTPEGEIVWEYLNPVRAGDGNRLVAVVSWGQRIDPKSLTVNFERP